MMKSLGGILLALLAASPAAATPAVTVSDAWMRALPGDLPAGGYFRLHNGSARKITLSGASSAACGMLMLHQSSVAGGMASMSDVPAIDVAPGATLSFSPGGYHLMCMDPAATIKPGGKVDVTLEFADGSKLAVTFPVRGANGH